LENAVGIIGRHGMLQPHDERRHQGRHGPLLLFAGELELPRQGFEACLGLRLSHQIEPVEHGRLLAC